MTDVLLLIKCQLEERNCRAFQVPANLLEKDDLLLVKRGVLKFNGKYKSETNCPECGERVSVARNGSAADPSYTYFCRNCEPWEDREIQPAEVELLDFNYRSFMLLLNDTTISSPYLDEATKCVSSLSVASSQNVCSSNRQAKIVPLLRDLLQVVEDACSNAHSGNFLFSRADYIAKVKELWANQASTDYAVARCDSAEVAELWFTIRTKLIAYAKSMQPVPMKIVRDLSSESCWLLFPKFVGVDDQPHVLDVTTLKELLATLNIADAPRRDIKQKKPRASTVKSGSQPSTVDIAALPIRAYRFAMTRDYRTIAVDEQVVPGCATEPYINLKPSAAKIIKTLIGAAGKKRCEGWVRPPKGENWRGVFQRKPYTRFRDEQLQIERRDDGLFYWRIIPNELYPEHYCKTHSRTPLF